MSRGRPPLTALPRVTMTTRLPQDLHQWLTDRAGAHSDSFNNELCRVLREVKNATDAGSPFNPMPT